MLPFRVGVRVESVGGTGPTTDRSHDKDAAAIPLGDALKLFLADRAKCSVQGMEEFIQVYELATGVLAACAPQRPDILHRGRDGGEAGCDVCPESLADPLLLFDHFRRKRDGHRFFLRRQGKLLPTMRRPDRLAPLPAAVVPRGRTRGISRASSSWCHPAVTLPSWDPPSPCPRASVFHLESRLRLALVNDKSGGGKTTPAIERSGTHGH